MELHEIVMKLVGPVNPIGEHIAACVNQRDKLLAALRLSRDCFRRMDPTDRREKALRVIDAAIANAKI